MKSLTLTIADTNTLIRNLKPVSVASVFTPSTQDFHPDGLYSTEIFGPVGSVDRLQNMAYIDLRLPVIQPKLYKELTKAKRLYQEILAGNKYAVFDKKEKDFILSDAIVGRTGFQFFMEHLNMLSPEDTGTLSRKQLRSLLKKHNNNLVTSSLLVIPVGLREYIVKPDGAPSDAEINGLYKKVIAVSNAIPKQSNQSGASEYDKTRYLIQQTVLEIRDMLATMVFGKHSFINNSISKRNVHGGSRNAITSAVPVPMDLDNPAIMDVMHIQSGLLQTAYSNPYTLAHTFRERLLVDNFSGGTILKMIDPNTLELVSVEYDQKLVDLFTSQIGTFDLLKKAGIVETLLAPIELNGYFLSLIYDDGDKFILVSDISRLPENIDRKKLRPATLLDLLYLAVEINTVGKSGLNTRYPVGGVGGIYPQRVKLKVSNVAETREWVTPEGESIQKLTNYPIPESGFIKALIPPPIHLAKFQGDYDGDTMSLFILVMDNANQEVNDFLGSTASVLAPTGGLIYSLHSTGVPLFLHHTTG